MRTLVRTLVFLALLAAAPTFAADRPDPLGDTRMPWLGVRLGGVIGLGSASGGQPGGAGGGAYLLFDERDFFGDVSVDIYVGDSVHFITAGLGGYFPFSHGNVSPYLGGGLKLGWTKFGGDGTFGLLPYAAFGLLMGRQGTVQLRAEIDYFVATASETRSDQPNSSGTHANGPIMTLGVAF